MTVYLFLMLISSRGVSTSSTPFSSLAACQAAAKTAEKELTRSSTLIAPLVTSTCMPKDGPDVREADPR